MREGEQTIISFASEIGGRGVIIEIEIRNKDNFLRTN
jgi:hypothetical protein